MYSKLLSIELPDGASTKITQFGETPDKQGSVFICLSAMGVAGSYYKKLAEHLAAKGHVAFTTDYRGIGHSSVRPPKADFGYKEIIEYDYKGIIETVISAFPEHPIYLFGHSLGGQLGGLYLGRYLPKQVKGIILIASCSVYYRGWPGLMAYATLFGTQLFALISRGLGYFPGKKLGFGGTEATTVMRDWSRQARTGKYLLGGSDFDYEGALAELKTPVLAISIQGDRLAPKTAIMNLYQKYHASAPIHHHHLSSQEAGIPKLNHFNWARQPSGVIKVVQSWLPH
ncbi:MAG: alpha/beta fold hydrolase [Saprospiraceae bacterium]|nr:alpha/beta fold hydrolase [Saprospiraceae bacterium]